MSHSNAPANAVVTAWLIVRALYELARFDVIHAWYGFAGIERQLVSQPVRDRPARAGSEEAVCEAVALASCLYCKPVLCLQRSACAARLLRRRGVAARLVIGYRPVPFYSHAWVDVGGRVVNDSPEYLKRLQILHTM
ncbi:MAG: lasso peptide biosynthesis B2 protein [Vicinamibacterales bacterium]